MPSIFCNHSVTKKWKRIKSERGQDPNVRGEVPFSLIDHYNHIFWRKKKNLLDRTTDGLTNQPTDGRRNSIELEFAFSLFVVKKLP